MCCKNWETHDCYQKCLALNKKVVCVGIKKDCEKTEHFEDKRKLNNK